MEIKRIQCDECGMKHEPRGMDGGRGLLVSVRMPKDLLEGQLPCREEKDFCDLVCLNIWLRREHFPEREEAGEHLKS